MAGTSDASQWDSSNAAWNIQTRNALGPDPKGRPMTEEEIAWELSEEGQRYGQAWSDYGLGLRRHRPKYTGPPSR